MKTSRVRQGLSIDRNVLSLEVVSFKTKTVLNSVQLKPFLFLSEVKTNYYVPLLLLEKPFTEQIEHHLCS